MSWGKKGSATESCGGLTSNFSPSTALSLPTQQDEVGKELEKLMVKTRSVTDYHNGKNGIDLGHLNAWIPLGGGSALCPTLQGPQVIWIPHHVVWKQR